MPRTGLFGKGWAYKVIQYGHCNLLTVGKILEHLGVFSNIDSQNIDIGVSDCFYCYIVGGNTGY